MEVPQIITIWSCNPTSWYIPPKDWKENLEEIAFLFTVAAFSVAKRWRKPKYPCMHERIDKIQYKHTMDISLKRKEYPLICYSMDEPWRQYAHRTDNAWFHFYSLSEIVIFIETESKVVVSRKWKEGRTRIYFLIGTEFQFCKIKLF